jgi:histidinol-phosphate aminotransferase
MSRSRRDFLQLVGSGGLAVAAGGCATASASQAPAAAAQAPPLGAPGTRSALLRLSSNENSAGPGEKVLAAMQDAFGIANRYSFRLGGELNDAVAASLGVSSSNVVLGCGSSEILDASVAAFVAPDRGLVTASPTFELVAGRAQALGAKVIAVPVDGELRLDLERMAASASGAGLVFVCNPNNPTGTVHGASAIEAMVASVLRVEPKATILVDEAYHHYVEHPDYKSAVPLALSNPRVVVSRTFSKIYGMAGLRVGYAVGHPSTIDAMSRFLDSGRLSCVSGRAALTALEDRARVDQMRTANTAARAMTAKVLSDAGYRVAPSEANFVMVDVRRDIRTFQQACRARGIEIARAFPPLMTWARITIGTMAEMEHAVVALKGALAEPAPTATLLEPVAPYLPRRDGSWVC